MIKNNERRKANYIVLIKAVVENFCFSSKNTFITLYIDVEIFYMDILKKNYGKYINLYFCLSTGDGLVATGHSFKYIWFHFWFKANIIHQKTLKRLACHIWILVNYIVAEKLTEQLFHAKLERISIDISRRMALDSLIRSYWLEYKSHLNRIESVRTESVGNDMWIFIK